MSKQLSQQLGDECTNLVKPPGWDPSIMYYIVITMLMTIFIVKMREMEMLEMENMVLLSVGLGWVGSGGIDGNCDTVVMVIILVEYQSWKMVAIVFIRGMVMVMLLRVVRNMAKVLVIGGTKDT